jgi:FMN-dependent NADH-azoreductase
MKKVLVINSSARMLNSRSRRLTEVFVGHWKSIHANPLICFRELGNACVPHITDNWIAAAFKPGSARSEAEIEVLKLSDTYISELREADVIVIGAPMYNWSVPSALKAYIDQVLRVNETFKISPADMQNPYVGLLENKALILLLSTGDEGYEKGQYNEHKDFQSNYLKTVFRVMGISNIHVISINGKSSGSMNDSHQNLRELMEREILLTKMHR